MCTTGSFQSRPRDLRSPSRPPPAGKLRALRAKRCRGGCRPHTGTRAPRARAPRAGPPGRPEATGGTEPVRRRIASAAGPSGPKHVPPRAAIDGTPAASHVPGKAVRLGPGQALRAERQHPGLDGLRARLQAPEDWRGTEGTSRWRQKKTIRTRALGSLNW